MSGTHRQTHIRKRRQPAACFYACINLNVLEHYAHETLSIHLDRYVHGRREQEPKVQSSFNTGKHNTEKTRKTP